MSNKNTRGETAIIWKTTERCSEKASRKKKEAKTKEEFFMRRYKPKISDSNTPYYYGGLKISGAKCANTNEISFTTSEMQF